MVLNLLSFFFNFRNVDIFIGALDETILTHKYFTASRSYYHDKITWCVRARQPTPKWKNLFKICNDTTVYTIYSLMVISFVFTSYFMQQFEDQQKWDGFKILLMAIANVCGSGSNYTPKILSHRIFFIISMFCGVLINIIVASFAMLFVTRLIFEKPIDSVQEIVKKQFELVGDEFGFQQLSKQKQVID